MKRVIISLSIGVTLAGCNTTPAERIVQTVTIEVPSSKPYRYITYDDKTPDPVAKQIRRHNRTHQAVINSEKAAKAAQ